VRKVARVAEEAHPVDDRKADERSLDLGVVEPLDDAADDLDAVELVAVDRRGQEDARPVLGSAHHGDRDVDWVRRVELADLEEDLLRLARADRLSRDDDVAAAGHGFTCLRGRRRDSAYAMVYSRMSRAMSLPVADSSPSNPGEELISMTL